MAHPAYNPHVYIPSNSNVTLFSPNNRFAYLPLDQSIADDISDLLDEAQSNGEIPLQSFDYRILIQSLETLQYTYTLNLTENIYRKIRRILDYAERRPTFMQPRVNSSFTTRKTLSFMQHYLSNLKLRLQVLQSSTQTPTTN